MGGVLSCCRKGGQDDSQRGRRNQRSFAEMEEIRRNGSCGTIQRPYHTTASRQASTENLNAGTSHEPLATHPLSGKGNQLVKRTTVTWEASMPMSRQDLEKQRREFWETAAEFGGKKEAWTALKGAMDVWDRDLDLARAIIDCAGLVLPGGELTEVYDELGFKYCIPEYCFNEPTNIIQESEKLSRRPSTRVLRTRSLSEEACRGAERRLTVRLSTGLDIHLFLKPSIKTIDDLSKAAVKEGDLTLAEGQKLLFFYSGRPLAQDTKLDDLERLDGKIPIQAWIQ